MAETEDLRAELATVKAERDAAVETGRVLDGMRDELLTVAGWLSPTGATRLRRQLAASGAREAAVRPVVEQLIAARHGLRAAEAAIRGEERGYITALIAEVERYRAAAKPAPRVWAMPSEPGPDVIRVRDVYGQCFERADAIDENGSEPGWLGDAFTNEADVPDLFLSWKTLMAHHAPLTEVVDALPADEEATDGTR